MSITWNVSKCIFRMGLRWWKWRGWVGKFLCFDAGRGDGSGGLTACNEHLGATPLAAHLPLSPNLLLTDHHPSCLTSSSKFSGPKDRTMHHREDPNSNLTLVTYFCVTLGKLLESEPQFLSVQWAHPPTKAGEGNGMMHVYIGKTPGHSRFS